MLSDEHQIPEEGAVVTERALPLKWTDALATGLAEVDEQHRQLQTDRAVH